MSRFLRRIRFLVLAAACGGACLPLQAPAAADSAEPALEKPVVLRSAPVAPHVFDGDVRDLPPPPKWHPGDPIKEIPRRLTSPPGYEPAPGSVEQGIDRLLGAQAGAPRSVDPTFVTPSRDFPGQGFTGVNPPDTVGDVGPSHYVQMVNSGDGAVVQIFDKAEPTPNVLATFNLDTLGTGVCASGFGDPIVLYDRLADRWLLTEFATSGNHLCMYVSQSPDPVSGGWFAYDFTTPNFPDYPKYAVWPTDANGGLGSYIVTSNETACAVYAMDRAKMLSGLPATFQRSEAPDLPGFPFNAVTPADLDGADGPPTGAPAVIMRQRDTEAHSGPPAPGDLLEMWNFDVDWVNEANTTFTQMPSIDVTEFDSDLCGLSAFACFPQPGTGTTLDPLREVIMNRLQYRNFGDYEALVGNFVTDVDGTDHGGVRWFELRRSGVGGWTLYQEGTFSPDSDNRWMGASAMDQSGNIAVAYNVTSTTTFPSLRYTGRLVDDPLGVMSQPETSIHAGTASNGSNRYGDYAAMSVDPTDDCTFWFTGMDNTESTWRTQIASFRFDACGCELFPLALTLDGAPFGDNRVDLTWNDSELDTVVEYRLRRSRTPGGPYTTIAVIPDSSPNTGNGAGYAYSDTTVSGGITYYYVVQASDGGACTSPVSNEISADATGVCLLEPIFSGLDTVQTPNSSICTLTLEWSPAVAQCGGAIHYDVYRSTTPGFTPDELTLIQSGVGTTAYADADVLVDGETYYYVVRAVDESNGVSEANLVERSAEPHGELQPPLFVDDAGDTSAAQLTGVSPWSVAATGGNFGPGVYETGSYGNDVCAALTTPPIALGSDNVLEFWSTYAIESGYDKGEVQISDDGGAGWTRLEVGYPGTSTHTSDACGLPTGSYFTGTGSGWAEYQADLSPWNGQTVQIRWEFSTDVSVNAAGWSVDDVAVVNHPATCATASACADNPLVDVLPDGPATACALSIPELSVALTGGVGPFSYQWFRDGAPITGATDPTYQPTEVGQHAYNVQVQAAGCADPVSDGQSTVLSVESRPRFDGVSAAIDRRDTTCGIDLVWNEATSACPGPLTYTIYRSTNPIVTPGPGTYLTTVAAGGGGYSDSAGLTEGVDYYYLVEATDASTLEQDGNTTIASAAPSGPDVISFYDDAGDTGTALLAPTAPWTVDGTGGDVGPSVYATGTYGNDVCSELSTPRIALNGGSVLQFASKYDIETGWDKGVVEISTDDGGSWTRVPVDYPGSSTHTSDACGLPTGSYFTGTSTTWAQYEADLSPWAGPAAILRWRLSTDGSVTQSGWWVDEITVLSAGSCATGVAGPPPAPDGHDATTPLRGERLTAGGDTLQVTWDASSCTASDYDLIYGDLHSVGGMVLDGAVCGIGTSGSFVWNGAPSGDLFFLVLGTDGAGGESSWGLDSAFRERNGFVSSGTCGVTFKDTTGACP